jgi:hypothetical protein
VALTSERNANTLYATGSGGPTTILTAKNSVVIGIIIATGAAAELLTLQDLTTNANKFKIKVAAGTSQYFDLSNSAVAFPNGIQATLTQADSYVTLIIQSGGG